MIKYTYKSLYKELFVVISFAFLIEFLLGVLAYDKSQSVDAYYKILFFTSFGVSVLNSYVFQLFNSVHFNHYLTLGITRSKLHALSYKLQIPMSLITLIPGITLLHNNPKALILKLIFVILLLPLNAYSVHEKHYGLSVLIVFSIIILSNNYVSALSLVAFFDIYFIFKNRQIFTKGNLI